MNFTLVAHRCGTDKYPELTLDSAKYSLSMGADCIEMDIRFTKDNIPVISHDKDALRLFGSDKLIENMGLEEFSALSYKNNPHYHAITLTEVLSSGIGPILFHVKVGGEKIKEILTHIEKFHYEKRVIMGVMHPEDVRIVKNAHPDIAVLAFMPSKEQIKEFIDAGADIIRLWEDWVFERKIHDIKNAGRKVWVMAGNPYKNSVGYTDDKNILKWKQMGIDGILINEIEKITALLQSP